MVFSQIAFWILVPTFTAALGGISGIFLFGRKKYEIMSQRNVKGVYDLALKNICDSIVTGFMLGGIACLTKTLLNKPKKEEKKE